MSALDAMLKAKPVSELTGKVEIERLGTSFTIRALTAEMAQQLREEATWQNAEGKPEVNNDQVAVLTVLRGVVDPNFNNPDLQKHIGVSSAEDCVKKGLTSVEFTKLSQAIVKLSGMNKATLAELTEVKN